MKGIVMEKSPAPGIDPLAFAFLAQAAVPAIFALQEIAELKEERLRRQQKIDRDLEPLRLKADAFKKALDAQVEVEKVRSQMLASALAVAASATDAGTQMEALRLAREVLNRKVSIPTRTGSAV